MKKLLLLSMLTYSISGLMAQEKCGTMIHHEMRKQQNPNYENQLNQIELFTQQFIAENENSAERNVITIPIVFHVVYRNAEQNISDAQINSQLTVLNEDYRKLNANFSNTPNVFQGVAADLEIQFCLATRDPQGNPTSGITRTQTTVNGFSTDDKVKFTNQGGINAWPRDQYLNIWVCDLGNNLLGYAQFPGDAAATDGVVILYTSVGRPPHNTFSPPYNLGRTLTHEVGHWLNLRHIWGDESNCSASDFVNDTPVQLDPNYGCKTHPSPTCNNGGDMFMNYMDYGDDNCLTMFTDGQKQRARALFAAGGARASLLNSQGCSGSVTPPTSCGDTLRFPLPGTAVLYFDQNDGYLAGSNVYEDRAKADRFTVSAPSQLSGGLFYFGIALANNQNLPITIKAWNADGPNQSPGTVLAQTTVPLSQIAQAITNQSYLSINFPSPVTVNGTFFLGFDVLPIANATIALVTNTDGNANPNTAWEQFANNTWKPYTDPDSWQISVNHAISAVLQAPQPTANFSVNPSLICEGQSVVYLPSTTAGITSYNWSFPNGSPSSSTAQSPSVTYNNQGNYGATLTIQSQCFTEQFTQTQNNIVGVNPAPPIPNITQQDNLLISNAAQGNQWFRNGILIQGATGQTFVPTQSGIYTVEVSNANCTSTSAPFNFTFVSVNDISQNTIVSYPNPSNDLLYIESPFMQNAKLTILDYSGKEIAASLLLNPGKNSISLKGLGLKQGLYLIKIDSGEKYFVHRIVFMP